MSQREAVLNLFQSYGGHVTLGQIMQTPLAAEYRARFTELRREGYRIELQRGERPSMNTYHLLPPTRPGEFL